MSTPLRTLVNDLLHDDVSTRRVRRRPGRVPRRSRLGRARRPGRRRRARRARRGAADRPGGTARRRRRRGRRSARCRRGDHRSRGRRRASPARHRPVPSGPGRTTAIDADDDADIARIGRRTIDETSTSRRRRRASDGRASTTSRGPDDEMPEVTRRRARRAADAGPTLGRPARRGSANPDEQCRPRRHELSTVGRRRACHRHSTTSDQDRRWLTPLHHSSPERSSCSPPPSGRPRPTVARI